MARTLKSDGLLFITTLGLVCIGLAFVYSASMMEVGAHLLIKQLLFVAIGMVGAFGAMKLDYHKVCNRRLLLCVVGTTAVVLMGIALFGHVAGGGRRWIGIAGFGIQPSELAKLVAVVFAALAIARRLEDRDPMEPAWFQTGAVSVVFAVLIFLERDMGGGLVLLAACFAIVFASGLAYRWVAVAALGGGPPILAVLLLVPHTRQRLLTWLDPFNDPFHDGYQTIQSWIAISTGGVLGKGYMESVQKLDFLPEAQNDYIFSLIAEEKGFVGAAVVLLGFAVIAWRGLLVARRAPDAFGSLLAVGLTALLVVPAMVNMGVATGLLPAKGIALPFVSAGGSSMIVSLLAMGVLLNISQQGSATAME